MRERIARFMAGRNGTDQFSMFLIAATLLCFLVASIAGGIIRIIFNILSIALLAYGYFRIFSKNVYKRREENSKYLRIRYGISARFHARKERWIQRKDYKFFSCPSCHATLRVPKGHGKVKIVCRKCGNSFVGKT